MTVHLNIHADVVGITTDAPQGADIFFVDTNVWFWQTYPNASASSFSSSTKISEYSSYLGSALSKGAVRQVSHDLGESKLLAVFIS